MSPVHNWSSYWEILTFFPLVVTDWCISNKVQSRINLCGNSGEWQSAIQIRIYCPHNHQIHNHAHCGNQMQPLVSSPAAPGDKQHWKILLPLYWNFIMPSFQWRCLEGQSFMRTHLHSVFFAALFTATPAKVCVVVKEEKLCLCFLMYLHLTKFEGCLLYMFMVDNKMFSFSFGFTASPSH